MSFRSRAQTVLVTVALLASPFAQASAQQQPGAPQQPWQQGGQQFGGQPSGPQGDRQQTGGGQPGAGQPSGGQPNGGQPSGAQPGGGQPAMQGNIAMHDVQVIREFVARNGAGVFGTPQPLPAGAVLMPGQPVPVGVPMRPLPPALVVGLPVYPGYDWVLIGTSVVLVAAATAVIVGVLTGAI